MRKSAPGWKIGCAKPSNSFLPVMEMEKTMQIIHSPEALHSVCAEWRRQGLKTALVPTMGYYHAGHASLISYARSVADKVIVSLFVNPTQFGPNEDLEAYPRDFEKDSALVRELGGDVLYAPEPENMYAPDHATWVEVPALANTLCGLSRPIHFRGVCTVVLKLFMLAQPSLAVFGEKDWQQLAIIKKMVSDLNVPVEVVGRPIVREADGLALSSRNVYLTPEERAQAPQIRKSLEMAAGLAAGRGGFTVTLGAVAAGGQQGKEHCYRQDQRQDLSLLHCKNLHSYFLYLDALRRDTRCVYRFSTRRRTYQQTPGSVAGAIISRLQVCCKAIVSKLLQTTNFPNKYAAISSISDEPL